MLRNIIGVMIGLFTAFVVTWSIYSINTMLYPLPEGLDMTDHEAMKEHIKTLPLTAYVIVLFAHAMAAFLGAFVACKIADTHHRYIAIGIGAFLLLMGVFNLISIPHPTWFAVADALTYIPFALMGYSLFEITSKRA